MLEYTGNFSETSWFSSSKERKSERKMEKEVGREGKVEEREGSREAGRKGERERRKAWKNMLLILKLLKSVLLSNNLLLHLLNLTFILILIQSLLLF